jgi:AAA15 family ATPase/GTPase
MIQEFSVENFRSIKTKQTLSFLANNKIQTGSEEYLCTQVTDTVRLLKLCVLYGYNASGKTNLLKALGFLRTIVLSAPDTKDEDTPFIPFALDKETRNQPGTFSLIFFIDRVRYEYTVCIDRKRIHRESLRFTPGGRVATLYTRTYDTENSVSKLTIGAKCSLSAKDKTILNGNTLENSTVLYAYQKSNIHSPALDIVIEYFKETLMPMITPSVLLRDWSLERLAGDTKRKQFYVKFLEKADFQIADLEIKNTSIAVDDELLNNLTEQGAPKGLLEQLKKDKHIETKDLYFTHETTQGAYQILAEDESQGTLRYFGLGGVLQELVAGSHVVAIDELESSLHPDLATFFLQMFLMNSKDSQILATTHAQYMMELDYMRNDMVWFCEKDETGGSEYYSAQDFKLHKNNNLANFYRSGKLGAKPILGSPVLDRSENE